MATSVSFALAATSEVENLGAALPTSAVGLALTGSNSANMITATAGKDTLSGLAGDDELAGGLGIDKLIGGVGKDKFDFTTKLGKTNVDTITDFSAKDDTIQIDNAIFKGLKAGKLASSAFFTGTKAHDSSDRVVYDSKSGKVYFDQDGSGSKAAIHFATLTNKAKGIAAADFFVI